MPSKSSLVEMTGIVSGLSHVFILKKQQLFIFNIATGTEVFPIVICNKALLPWQAELRIGLAYTCCNLRQTKLYQQTKDEVEVFVTTSQTKIILATTDNARQFAEDPESFKFLSYEGTVTAADPSLQLFELDGSCQLVLSSIAGISSCPQLVYGDRVVVHDGHWEPADKRLYTCGRTLVRVLNRTAEPVRPSKRAAVHTLHRFVLPARAVDWYRQTAGVITAAAGQRAGEVSGEDGALHRLLLAESLPAAERSLTKEFVCRPHRCAASHQFRPPFQLLPLSDLASAVVTESETSAPSGGLGWHCWVDRAADRRTVALLTDDPSGGLLLVSDEGGGGGGGCRVPLLLLPSDAPAPAPAPAGRLVCVSGARPVVERFGSEQPQVYLLCTGDQLVPLQDDPEPPLPPPPPASEARLLLYHRGAARRAAGGDVQVLLHGLLEEPGRRRPVLLRLTAAATGRGRRLDPGATYLLQTADCHWTAREQSCDPLRRSLQPWLADCPLLAGPDDLQFTADCCPAAPQQCLLSDTLSVSELTPGAGADDGLLTVRGVIVERSHARDRFAAAAQRPAVSLDTHRVVLRLGDPVTSDEVCLYVDGPSRWVSLLGLVPGAALTARAVRWAGRQGAAAAGTAGTHLVTTPLSELEVTGWSPPTERTAAKRPRLHLPVRFLSAALGDGALTRWLSCVTVADLSRVSLSAECGLCGHQLAAGCCTFVGCHGRGPRVINARARAVLDDGSAAVTAQLIGDSVRHLLAVSDAQWARLTEEAELNGEIYHLQSRTKKGGRPPVTAGSLAAACRSDAIRRPIICELKKFADRSAAGRPAPAPVRTVFCEAVMEATAALVTRLYPAPATAGTAPPDVPMVG